MSSVTLSLKDAPATRKLSAVRIPELDGVRAVAVWLVLLLHLFATDTFTDQATASVVPRIFLPIIRHGWMGVDLFFVLSGFLITGILLDSKNSPHYIRNFYVRRFFRIIPLYLATIVVFWAFYGNWKYFLMSAFFLANVTPLFGVETPHGPGVYWSLAVEEHFYLAWPWLVLVTRKRTLAAICALIIVVEPVWRFFWGHDYYPYSWLRFDGLASGALLAIWIRSRAATRSRTLLLAAAALLLLAAISVAGRPYGLFTAETHLADSLRCTQGNLLFGALIATAFALRSTPWTSILRTRFATLSGEYSYCLYLIHLSLWDAYMYLAGRLHLTELQAPFVFVLTRAVIILLVCFGIAALSSKYFERPMLAMKERFTGRALAAVANPL